nr:MAG TPA: hypothetical protein [Caudoviricetes sp.]
MFRYNKTDHSIKCNSLTNYYSIVTIILYILSLH